jgi:hypothetical protein
METVTSIQLEDARLQEELNRALGALVSARDQDKKPVSINFTGEGDRRVRIGYVVETPIWKTSYRLILPADSKEKSKLQGWAIVENQTDNDWNNIQLSLISGRPISFVQDLYQPLYIPRPVVQPELFASLRPQEYAGGIAVGKKAEGFVMNTPAAEAPMPTLQPAAPKELAQAARQFGAVRGTGAGSMYWDSEGIAGINATSSVHSLASAAKLGELFQYTVPGVSLPRQRSAMIPIITDDIEVERLSIYNAGVLAKNPLTGARVKNTTDKHLLAGPVTVLDNSAYAGDARVDNLPPGQERLLSYGVDLQMLVDSTKNKEESQVITGKIIKGVLQLTYKYFSNQEYLADNKSDHEKTLIIEHPLRPGWKLVDTLKPIETTDSLYRFKGQVGTGKTSKLVVKEEIVQDQAIAILPSEARQLELYSKSGEIPKDVRDALIKAAQFKQAQAETQRQIDEKINASNKSPTSSSGCART